MFKAVAGPASCCPCLAFTSRGWGQELCRGPFSQMPSKDPKAPSYLNGRLLGYVTIGNIEPRTHYLGNWSPREMFSDVASAPISACLSREILRACVFRELATLGQVRRMYSYDDAEPDPRFSFFFGGGGLGLRVVCGSGAIMKLLVLCSSMLSASDEAL